MHADAGPAIHLLHAPLEVTLPFGFEVVATIFPFVSRDSHAAISRHRMRVRRVDLPSLDICEAETLYYMHNTCFILQVVSKSSDKHNVPSCFFRVICKLPMVVIEAGSGRQTLSSGS